MKTEISGLVALGFLSLAIGFEVAGTISMKLSHGFSKPMESVLIFIFYGCSLMALTVALTRIEVSVAYAVWSGLGTALITAIGVVVFAEHISTAKIACIGLIILGVAGLHFEGQSHQ